MATSKSKETPARPTAADFWTAYPNYDAYDQDAAWGKVGHGLAEQYKGENSCAARISYGLNYGGDPIPSRPEFQTNLNGDGMRYVLSAARLRQYLLWRWGSPDFTWPGVGQQSIAQVRKLIPAGAIAVAAWDGHSAVVTSQYADPYTPGTGTGNVWLLRGHRDAGAAT